MDSSLKKVSCETRVSLDRRRRINNSLDQLRTLLPYSVNMKKDMASLLEQTVEYINIMHTVLNENKPACLNQVYLSYRKKTEELESFRKNFKKTVNKKVKSEPGCSWGQTYPSFMHQNQGEVDTFVKFHGITSSYPEPSRINPNHPHQWNVKIANCPPPPTNPIAYGKPGGQGNYSLSHTASSSRTNFYQPSTVPVKPYEPFSHTNSLSSTDDTQTPTEIGKIHHPMMKSDCWQPTQSYQAKQISESSRIAGHQIAGSSSSANDWYRCYGIQNTKQDLHERPNQVDQLDQSTCYDENNNQQESPATTSNNQPNLIPTPEKAPSEKENSASTPLVTVSTQNEQTTEEEKVVNQSSCNITNAAIATGLIKCSSLPKQESNSPPELYFTNTNNPENTNISNPFNTLSSWMAPCTSLPALSLAQNYLGGQQNITVNTTTNNTASPVNESTSHVLKGAMQLVKIPSIDT